MPTSMHWLSKGEVGKGKGKKPRRCALQGEACSGQAGWELLRPRGWAGSELQTAGETPAGTGPYVVEQNGLLSTKEWPWEGRAGQAGRNQALTGHMHIREPETFPG